MKTSVAVVGSIAVAHMIAGSALLMQGCGTTRGPMELPEEVSMPPRTYTPDPIVPSDPVVRTIGESPSVIATDPEIKSWATVKTTVYTVKSGDVISRIAARYDLTVAEIMALNELTDPNRVRVGQKLLLPGSVDLATPAARSAAPKTVAPKNGALYVVSSGDCLSKIAVAYGVSQQAIRDANGMKGDLVYVGQKLVIPGGKLKQPKVATPAAVPSLLPAPAPINLMTPARVSPQVDAGVVESTLPMLTPVDEPEPGAMRDHLIGEGDSMLGISSRYNVSISDLKAANPGLSNVTLVPGKTIKVPMGE
jgi:LysM repeat protein